MSDLVPARHEGKDVNIRGLLVSATILAVSIATAFVVAWGGFNFLSERNQERTSSAFPLAAQQRNRLPPEPRLEAIDRLEGMSTAPSPDLESYGWVDKNAGVVRIPLNRAMKIIVDNNLLPARSKEPRTGQTGRKP